MYFYVKVASSVTIHYCRNAGQVAGGVIKHGNDEIFIDKFYILDYGNICIFIFSW